jgi:hypothetical protein
MPSARSKKRVFSKLARTPRCIAQVVLKDAAPYVSRTLYRFHLVYFAVTVCSPNEEHISRVNAAAGGEL